MANYMCTLARTIVAVPIYITVTVHLALPFCNQCSPKLVEICEI